MTTRRKFGFGIAAIIAAQRAPAALVRSIVAGRSMGACGFSQKSKPITDFWGLKFTAKAANSTVKITKSGSPPNASFEISTDNGMTWSQYTVGDTISIANIGDSVCFSALEGTTNATIGNGARAFHRFHFGGDVAQTGSLLSLVNKDKNTAVGATLTAGCFRNLLQGGAVDRPDCLSEGQLILFGKNLSGIGYSLTSLFNSMSPLSKITTDIENWNVGVFTSWVNGVSANGEFHCPAQLGTNETIERGVDRCPVGWTVINDV